LDIGYKPSKAELEDRMEVKPSDPGIIEKRKLIIAHHDLKGSD